MILSRTIKQGMKMMCVQQHKKCESGRKQGFLHTHTHTHTLLSSAEKNLTNNVIYQKFQREVFLWNFLCIL